MDTRKCFNNPKLEQRRQNLIRRARADEALRAQKKRAAVSPVVEVRAALEGANAGPVGRLLLHYTRGTKKSKPGRRAVEALERLAMVAVEQTSLLEVGQYRTYLPALARLAAHRDRWVREPGAWRCRTHNVGRQFASLVRHLLARYDVPPFFDEVWLHDAEAHRQGWYVHVAQGGNLRTASGLPIPLTKTMAHHAMHPPDGMGVTQALRYGQARGIGVEPRIAVAVIASNLGMSFYGAEAEAFWSTVLNFLALNPMIDANQVGPVIDYLNNQRFTPQAPMWVNGVFVQRPPAQPNLTMKGRTPESLIAQVDAWHRQLTRRRRHGGDTSWPSCGIAGYDRIEGDAGNQRRFTITELLGSTHLADEGAAMRHCVATYAASCSSGRSAIYSMKVHDGHGERRLLTIEVNVAHRQIVQARGRRNEPSTPLDQRVMNAWATVARLTLGRFALARWA